MSLKGTYTVTVTPFTQDGTKVETSVLRDYVDWQVEQGAHGLIPLGSTGEFLSLTRLERTLVAKTVIDRAKNKVPVLIGTGAESAWDVVDLSKEAQDLGADGVLIIPPFYSTPTEEELIRYYSVIGESVTIPIMLYNNPATANVDLSPQLVAELSRIPNIDLIKESTMDVTRVRDILKLCDGRMSVFGGIMGYESFLNGADGWASVGSNLMPGEFASMYDKCVIEEDLAAARNLYRHILPVIELVAGHRYVGATKKALQLMGLPVGPPRSPRLESTGEELEWVNRTVRGLKLSVNR